tara:strand:+ start:15020 stop:15532 length:513 start_codon:yes stop_codon:yes gene_type:complete
MRMKNRIFATFRTLSLLVAMLILSNAIGFSALAKATERADNADVAEIQTDIHAGIQAVILKQIDAFKQDDAHTAFAIAAPEIQQRFGSSAMFMQMVRQGYATVYRPRYIEFGPLVPYGTASENTGRFVQHVVLEGADGEVMMAVYAMQKDEVGNWRIAGCNLTPLQRESL